jgi:hypothetical protein
MIAAWNWLQLDKISVLLAGASYDRGAGLAEAVVPGLHRALGLPEALLASRPAVPGGQWSLGSIEPSRQQGQRISMRKLGFVTHSVFRYHEF